MSALRLFVLLIFTAWLGCGAAHAEKRVALVIGNSAYKSVPRLANPVRDAALVANMFKDAGFDAVITKLDLDANEMRRTLREFGARVRDADIAVIYYAGHGMEMDGNNYLIPTDAVLETDGDVLDETIPLDRVLFAVEPAKQLRLIILDACRDNPFAKTMKRTIASRGVGRGLAIVEPTTPNTMIAFAAKAGSTASDGGGENGPFAKALVDNLPRPGLDLRLAFGYVRDAVLKNTGYQQEPYVYGSLGGDKVSLVPVKPIDTGPKPNPQDDIRKDYELTLQLGTRDAWNVFLAHYPDGFYADLARVQLNKIVAEEVRAAAEEKARVAEEKARLAAEGGKQAEQEKATAAAKAAKEARLAAEKAKQIEQAKAEAAEQARAAAEKAASQIAAAETAEADRKTTEQAAAEKAVVEARDRQAASEHTLSASAQHEKEVQKLAALPPREAETSLAPISAKNIAKSVQLQLQRVGCLSGEANGDWNIASQRSLAQFNKYAGTKFDIKAASIDALDAVSAKTGRVCPLVCDRGYRADRESCVKITCRADQILNGDGECEQQRKHESLVSKGDQFPSGKPDKAGPKQQTGGRCTSVSQRCAIQIGGRCNPSTGHWEYGRNGAGGSTLAFNNCVGQMLAGSKR